MLPHMDAAYNLARYLTHDAAAAEDVVQEAFLRAFKAFDSYRGGPPKAWLFAILRNCWRDRVGEQMRRERVVISDGALSETQAGLVADHADDADTPEEMLARAREIDTVRGVIANLPEPFRETLVLREMEELSYREIAAMTGVPIGTVMSRLARAREMLASLLLPVSGRQERQA
jgi:RNA polymerase sigma factor (sigma-70 family)